MAMIEDAMGADVVPSEPDRGCIPRVLGFFSTREELHIYVTEPLPEAERVRLTAMWERVHVSGELAELAGVRR
jgi:hypothetical protein